MAGVTKAELPARRLGARGPAVTRLGLGAAPLGNLFSSLSDATAEATVGAAWDAGIRFFDTAPLYGHGLSERRLGRALRSRPRDEYVIASKVGRLLRPSVGESLPSVFVPWVLRSTLSMCGAAGLDAA